MKTQSPFLNYISDYMLVRQYSLRTINTYLKWIASYIHFHKKDILLQWEITKLSAIWTTLC
ncbi:hypothetical protein AN392_00691 [Pseudoalteromonas sp. P1-16-1b]|nr:hypothetical protein AN392_00691 [Pseudoalteromonas sp. P1-16-1b]